MSYAVLANATGYLSIMKYANGIVGGAYGISILVSIFVIIIIAGLNYPPKHNILGALFVTLISSVFLFTMEMIEFYWCEALFVAFLACLAYNVLSQQT